MTIKNRLALGTMVAGCILATSTYAQEDNVYIDLSVLDGLSSAPAIVSGNATEPLFPIVKKAPKVKKKATTKAKPKIAKDKADLAKDIVYAPAPKVEKAPKHQQIPYVESSEPVVVVDVEPIKEKAPKDVVAETVETPKSVAPIELPVAEEKTTEDYNSKAEALPSLLVDENSQPQSKSDKASKLLFADGADVLTEEHKAQIDAIIASFENALVNKIAIYSYNLDDGIDAFKKKRLSLNRAVEVRSYLLPKGFKNFSIKVVNVDASSGKANMVELEELKN